MTACIEDFVAGALGVDVSTVTDDLCYQSISQWDSLGHVTLMIALEDALGTLIPDELVVELHSVGAIRAFVESFHSNDPSPLRSRTNDAGVARDLPFVRRGLEGVQIDVTSIARIDPDVPTLEYRGYAVPDLAEHASFEETAWLLLRGELPNLNECAAFAHQLECQRRLPDPIFAVLASLRTARPVDALRTGISALGAVERPPHSGELSHGYAAAVRLIAQVSALIAAHHAIRSDRPVPDPRGPSGYAATLLHAILFREPAPHHVRYFERNLILHADHGSNASSFAARVATGAGADLHAAVVAAVGTFSGGLHGGAVESVLSMIDAVQTPDRAAAFVRDRIARRERVPGFGHRVYRSEDPRVEPMRRAVRELCDETGEGHYLRIAEALIAAMERYAKHGVAPNVDLYGGLVYRLLGVPDDLAVPLFLAGRVVGIVTHVLEQSAANVLIRPLLRYVGSSGRQYSPCR